MESDIARILTALVLALPGYAWWRGLRRRDPQAARRYGFGVAAMAATMIAVAMAVGLAMPAGGGAAAWAAIAALLLLAAATVGAFLLFAVPAENRGGLGAAALGRATLLLAIAGATAFAVMMAQAGPG